MWFSELLGALVMLAIVIPSMFSLAIICLTVVTVTMFLYIPYRAGCNMFQELKKMYANFKDSIFIVRSTYGDIYAKRDTGKIVGITYHPGGEGKLENIERFDIEEWKSFYNEPIPNEEDIVNIGIFFKDGNYSEPCKLYREEIK